MPSNSVFDRRVFLARSAGVALALPTLTAATRRPGEISWQQDPVLTYIRVVADLRGRDTWKWFTGRMHAALADGAIVPLIGFESVIRRRALARDAPSIPLLFTEATVFCDLQSGEVIDTFSNPINGRQTRPLHYPEGPNRLSTTAAMFAPDGGFGPWLTSDGVARFTRETRVDAPHPLDAATWKLESSGPRFRALTLRSYAVEVAALADSARSSVPADYSLTVLSSWMPWMLLGSTPGQLLWSAQGRKVDDLDEVPAALRRRIASRFPELFSREGPQSGPSSFLEWHRIQRRPE